MILMISKSRPRIPSLEQVFIDILSHLDFDAKGQPRFAGRGRTFERIESITF